MLEKMGREVSWGARLARARNGTRVLLLTRRLREREVIVGWRRAARKGAGGKSWMVRCESWNGSVSERLARVKRSTLKEVTPAAQNQRASTIED